MTIPVFSFQKRNKIFRFYFKDPILNPFKLSIALTSEIEFNELPVA